MKILGIFAVAALAMGIAFPAAAEAMRTVQFDVPSTDGVVIHGQLDLPDGQPKAFVILVSGTGGFDRDVFLGHSGTPRDMVFLDLENNLVAKGIAVVRFDKRGVNCDARKLKAFKGAALPPNMWAPAGACEDADALRRVGANSGSEDVAAVYRWTRAFAPGGRIIVFAHSEGMLQVAQAVESGLIKPAAIVGMGGLMESPVSVFRWQRVDRIPESMAAMDVNHDQVVTNDEVRAGFARTPAAVFGNINLFLAPTGSFNQADLAKIADFWRDYYDKEKADALSKADSEPFMLGDTVAGSYGWWKTWFTDTTPVAQRLSAYSGSIRLFYGLIDSQTPLKRQRPAIDKYLASADVKVFELPDLGHTLGRDVFLGPIDPSAMGQIITAIDLLATSHRKPS
jgi:hypothetical protein